MENKLIALVVILLLVFALPLALSPTPIMYILGLLFWGPIMILLENYQKE